MVERQRVAKWFLILACLVVLTCTTQRMAGMHMLSKYLPTDVTATQITGESQNGDSQESPISPCELSAKSLLAANSMAIEHLFLRCCCSLLYCLSLRGSCDCSFPLYGLCLYPACGYISGCVSSENNFLRDGLLT